MKGNIKLSLFLFTLIWFPNSGEDQVERFNFKRDFTANTDLACSIGKEPYVFTEDYPVGRIISPGYNVEAFYTKNVFCKWLIKAPPGKVILISIERYSFGLDDEGSAKLIIYDGPEEKQLAVATRRFNLSKIFTSKTNQVKIVFNGAERGKGFEFYYKHIDPPQECSLTLDKQCRNKFQCYSKSDICDSKNSCIDGTDEEDCVRSEHDLSFPEQCGTPVIPPSILGAHIYGGEKVIPGSWPWLVSLRYPKSAPVDHVCGGVLLNRLWVVTAAHCLLFGNTKLFEVDFGRFNSMIDTSGKEVKRYIDQYFTHPSFMADGTVPENGNFTKFDIALIKLNAPVPIDNDYIKPICLPESGLVIEENSSAFVVGWGNPSKIDTEELFLKQAGVPVISLDRCKKQHPYDADTLGEHVICAGKLEGGTDSCEGDSGGPLMNYNAAKKQWQLIGTVMSGEKNCGEEGKAGAYAYVPYYRNWIDQTIRNN